MKGRTAEQPGQAINIDLCYVPEKHKAQEKLPAVSGSSGRLVVEHLTSLEHVSSWPGQIFAEAMLDYETAMKQYSEQTRDRLVHHQTPSDRQPGVPTRWRQEWEGRASRYQLRQQRLQEDQAWRTATLKWRQTRLDYQALTSAERQQQKEAFERSRQQRQEQRQQRQQTLFNRKEENRLWHQRNQLLKPDQPIPTETRSWLAVLVVTDNCTRQCLGLPVFRSGSKLTSDEVIVALQAILPVELQFLISDQGTHFRSKAFAQLAQDKDFVHIPIFRHRPQTNGIAERFVLTLKNWLRDKSWDTVSEFELWSAQFRLFYNDRPHQGLPFPGLSPDEFANRIWLI